VESLAAGAYGVMKGTKRKTMKFTDIGAPTPCCAPLARVLSLRCVLALLTAYRVTPAQSNT
jgi:hypothetical protein